MKSILQRTTIREILELPDRPTLDDVKKNYKRLVKVYHPDINKSPEAAEYMKRINQAYSQAIKLITNQRPQQQPFRREQYRGTIIININFYRGTNATTWVYEEY